jgi:hypothetical protein
MLAPFSTPSEIILIFFDLTIDNNDANRLSVFPIVASGSAPGQIVPKIA